MKNMLEKFSGKKFIYTLLIFIFLFGTFLRFYKIGQVPVSLYWDEVASGYNAYSIAYTLHDEYGNFMPLLFRSFDDYKMSGDIYLTAIIVKIFGFNDQTALASSAIAGSLTILLLFFMVKELFSIEQISLGLKNKVYSHSLLPEILGLISAGMLAISPWHFAFSRSGFEANTGLLFVILGAYLFFKGLKKKIFLIFSCVTFGLSLYFYRSIDAFVPLFLFCLLFIFRKELMHIKKTTVIAFGLFLIIGLPIFYQLYFSKGIARFQQVNIATNRTGLDDVYEKAFIDSPGQTGRILFNKRESKIIQFLDNYVSHFGFSFLFLQGDGTSRHSTISMGLLYLFEIPFWLTGLYILFKLPKKIRYTLLSWILITPIPASISLPSPHALRDLNAVPIMEVLTAMGIIARYLVLSKRMKYIFSGLLLVVMVSSFVQYQILYYGITARNASADWGDGYKQLTEYVFAHEGKYEKVLVTGHYWKPYIYFLFYKKYDPLLFQKSGNEFGFDKYVFTGTSWGGLPELDHVNLRDVAHTKGLILVAVTPLEYASQNDKMFKLAEIKNHKNDTVFIIGEVK